MAMFFKRMFISNYWGFRRQNWLRISNVNDPLYTLVRHECIKPSCLGGYSLELAFAFCDMN